MRLLKKLLKKLLKNRFNQQILLLSILITVISVGCATKPKIDVLRQHNVSNNVVSLNYSKDANMMSFKITNVYDKILGYPTITLTCSFNTQRMSRSYSIGTIKKNVSKIFEWDINYNQCDTIKLDYIFTLIDSASYFDKMNDKTKLYNSLNRSLQGVLYIKE